ncbi:MAG: uroporphyrinogen-III synthase [Pseudomonadota bacterium]
MREAEALDALGLEPVIAPLTEIRAEVPPPVPPSDAEALLLTSAHAVPAAAATAGHLPAYCVGPATAAAAAAAGLRVVPGTAEDGDATTLAARAVAAPERCFFHPGGADLAGDIDATLAAAGKLLRTAVAYRAVPCALPREAEAALAAGELAVAGFWSPRNAALFADHARAAGWPLDRLVAVTLSPAVAAPLAALGFASLRIAPARRGDAMREALVAAALSVQTAIDASSTNLTE